jgi:uncharacterized protein YjiS (DUF1127 family)
MRTASIPMVTGAASISAIGRALIVAAKVVIAALDRWQARRHALRQLYLLDRRTLKDIGIDRSEVHSVVFGDTFGRRRFHAGR